MTAATAVSVSTWLRRAVPDMQSLAGKRIEDLAIVMGAVIATLDAVGDEVGPGGRMLLAWRRLACCHKTVTLQSFGLS